MLQRILSPRQSAVVFRWFYLTTCIGVILHEHAHKRFAKACGLEIYDVTYFNLDNPHLGYVTHSPPRSYLDMFAINIAPVLLNTTLGLLAYTLIITMISLSPTSDFGTWQWIVVGHGAWAATAITIHAPISRGDLSNINNAMKAVWRYREPIAVYWVIARIQLPHRPNTLFYGTVVQAAVALKTVCMVVLWCVLKLFHTLIFTLLHPDIILTQPLVVALDIIDRLRGYGGITLFTAGVIKLAHYLTTTEVLPLLASL